MTASSSQVKEFKEALESEAGIYQVRISVEAIERLSEYYDLLSSWNARLHLVAPCTPREFATRHVLESLMLLPHLPRAATIADVGSGAGLPIIPCLIARPDITATLIESSRKKAVFLREALNRAEVSKRATVIAERFEEIPASAVNFITCRALDRFAAQLASLLKWSPPGSILLFFGGERLRDQIINLKLICTEIHIPGSQRRYIFVIRREVTASGRADENPFPCR
ncbi:MAG: 16S rRNA (guanine(527)-N(7))-methyltransferase RsmG [Pyrinomonadaceae bacterium]|nr:16S rRNA (guanine(527)-N(7))-methyltransferase RsmG [Pyrinomonadaceae bacterium]